MQEKEPQYPLAFSFVGIRARDERALNLWPLIAPLFGEGLKGTGGDVTPRLKKGKVEPEKHSRSDLTRFRPPRVDLDTGGVMDCRDYM